MSVPFDLDRWRAALGPLRWIAQAQANEGPPPPEIDPLRFSVDVRWGILIVVAIVIAGGLWYAGNRRQ